MDRGYRPSQYGGGYCANRAHVLTEYPPGEAIKEANQQPIAVLFLHRQASVAFHLGDDGVVGSRAGTYVENGSGHRNRLGSRYHRLARASLRRPEGADRAHVLAVHPTSAAIGKAYEQPTTLLFLHCKVGALLDLSDNAVVSSWTGPYVKGRGRDGDLGCLGMNHGERMGDLNG